MSDKQETSADIIAEMRDRKSQLEDAIFNAPLCYSTDNMRAKVEILDEFTDRFEAAHRRELSEITSKNKADFGQLGDSAKLREALEYIVNERGILDFCHNDISSKTWEDLDKVYKVLGKMIEKAISALAEPVKNYEVGTWKEQRARWNAFCDGHGDTCETCPLMGEGEDSTDCFVIWSQMPYEAQKGGEQ